MTKANHSLRAWQLNGADFDFDTVLDADIELVADWMIDSFDVIWVADGSQFASNRVDYGESTPVPASNPTKAADAQYTWWFAGWDPAPDATVSSNATYTAVFTNTVNRYAVTFTWHEGSTTNDYDYGTAAADVVVPSTPAPYTANGMVYTFEAWLPAIADVTNDVDYVAQYSSAPAVEPEPIDLDAQTFSPEEVEGGAIPAGIVTDEASGETEFVVCFHGQAGMTYTLQGSTTLNPADWASTNLVVGTPVSCTNNGDLVKLEFPLDGANIPDVMFFKIGTSRTPAAGE